MWALGDVTHPLQLKHTANAEARIIAHNLLDQNNLKKIDRSVIPKAVFGNPLQIVYPTLWLSGFLAFWLVGEPTEF